MTNCYVETALTRPKTSLKKTLLTNNHYIGVHTSTGKGLGSTMSPALTHPFFALKTPSERGEKVICALPDCCVTQRNTHNKNKPSPSSAHTHSRALPPAAAPPDDTHSPSRAPHKPILFPAADRASPIGYPVKVFPPSCSGLISNLLLTLRGAARDSWRCSCFPWGAAALG